jgi:pSer/pThr/pTyr-binding forkhead associated (FHA) protein
MAVKQAQPPKVHVLTIKDDTGKRQMLLKKSRYSVGRSQQCDIRIQSPFVSRHHATIVRQLDEQGATYYEILDGDGRKASANGILINGKKTNNQQLKNGDKVVFGPQVFLQYQHCQRDIVPSIPPDDPFDITFIDPAMINNNFDD